MLAALLAGLSLASGALPLGENYSALELSKTGVPWVTERIGPSHGGWGMVGGPLHTLRVTDQWEGSLVPRPDGGMWVVADDRTVLRVGPDGSAATFHISPPYAEATGAQLFAAGLPDGSLVLARALTRLERIAPDGTVSAYPTAVHKPEFCQSEDMVSLADGSLVLDDAVCQRFITIAPGGAATEVPIPDDVNVSGLLAHSDGSVWVALFKGLGHVVGGTFTQLAAPGDPGTLAEAPDGTVWATQYGECALVHEVDGAVTRVGAPFPVFELRLAADGSAWLMGATRLAHVAAPVAVAHCDDDDPRVSLPDLHHGKISLAALRRGLRVHVSERAVLFGTLALNENQTFERVVRGTVRIKLARRLRRSLKVGAELQVILDAFDKNGNVGQLELPGESIVKVTR